MSEYVKVNFGHMEQTREELAKVVEAMDRATTELYTKLKTRLGGLPDGEDPVQGTPDGVWTGEAARYFDAHRMIWDRAEQEMKSQLAQVMGALNTANENYQLAEAKNKARWNV